MRHTTRRPRLLRIAATLTVALAAAFASVSSAQLAQAQGDSDIWCLVASPGTNGTCDHRVDR